MPDSALNSNELLTEITALILENISNEQFGVSELADAMNMSRSNLLRKVKKETSMSVSQLIRQVRLERGMHLLRNSDSNVSEISHQVGFGSTSYFIKCFREHYGYPPGEVGKHDNVGEAVVQIPARRNNKKLILAALGLLLVLMAGLLTYSMWPSGSPVEKSIAVLPFKNDSNDSTNLYLINGLMESTLTNLQAIRDLKVISRTSVEKYRNTSKSIPEMAQELNVNYFVEGSGQKIGDQILLNIQLIDAVTDKHLWARQYKREAKDIFELQQEIAKNIAEEIQVVITPEAEKEIEKIPTNNLVAYDFYLKGRDLFYESTGESLMKSIPYFKQAIEHDPKFSLAYANAVMVYYYLDVFMTDKMYTAEIDSYADLALSIDPKLPESLIAKGLSYAQKHDYVRAVPYLEKALEYNPDSGLVIHFLNEFYSLYVNHPGKYLEYALKGVKLEMPTGDSAALSFKYFHLSNAFMQAGFINEGIENMEKSLAYDPGNYFSRYVSVLFFSTRNKDLKKTRDLLIAEYMKDTTRVDIAQAVAKTFYVLREFKDAQQYYNKFLRLKKEQHLELFKEEDLAIGIVFSKVGLTEKSIEHVRLFKDFADQNETLYKHFYLGCYYSYLGDSQKAIEHLTQFSKEDQYVYWILLLGNDPVVDPIKDLPAFRKIMSDLESKFWKRNQEIRKELTKKGLL